MLRAFLRSALGWILGLFFRRIEISGVNRVPARGPVIFAINHPNGLVDGLLLLSYAPRPVSFLAKAPLFDLPVIGWVIRSLDTIPVYRREDQADLSQNRRTFERARELLSRGGTIAIAPEGASHSDPSLRPLKTGAARIALGAAIGTPVAIVPVGLFYTEKAKFRSAAHVSFGEPVLVDPTPLDDLGEPPPPLVERLTARIELALTEAVLQADHQEALTLVTRTERLLAATTSHPKSRSVREVHATQRLLLDGYRTMKATSPELLDELIRRIDRLEAAFQSANLDPGHPLPHTLNAVELTRATLWLVFRVAIFLPLALPGLLLHYPAYWTIGRLAPRYAGAHDDILATAKILGAAFLYPLTWIGAGAGAGLIWGFPLGAAAVAIAPVSGFAALKLVERFDRFLTATRAIGLYLTHPEEVRRLTAEREHLRHDLETLGRTFGLVT